MTPEEFKAIRSKLGLSANKMAVALRLADGRTIRRYEAGDIEISGPVQRLMREFEAGTIKPCDPP